MQRVSRRDFLRLSGMASAGLAIAACAPAPGAGGETSAEQPAGEPAREAAELSLMMVDYAEPTQVALEEEIIPAFTAENEGSTVNVNYTSWERYNEEMTTAFAGGVTPDVFQGGAVWAPQMAKRGWSLPLTGYIEATGEDWNWGDFFEALQDDVTIDGEIVGVPYRIDIRSFWYRQDQVDEAGTTPPTNWEELREFANAMTVREGDQITREGYHFSSPGGWQNDLQAYVQFMEMAGGQFLSDDLSRCTLDEPPAVEALEYVYTLVVEDQVQPYPGFEDQGDLSPIALGMASSTYDSSFLERDVLLYAPEELEHLVVTLPLEHAVQACHVWVNKFFASSQSKSPDMAWTFLKHLTSPQMLEIYCASAGVTPPRRSLADAEFMTERMKVLLAATEFAVPYPKHWRLIELFRPLANNLELCLRDEISPQQAMEQTAEAINQILAEDA